MSKFLSQTVSAVVGTLFVIAALCLASERRRADQLGITFSKSTVVRLDSAARGGNSGSSGSSSSSSSNALDLGSAGSSAQGAVAAALPSAPPEVGRRPSLTVVCVSDTHNLYMEKGLIKVPEGDMLLFPGDAEVGTAAEGLAFSHWLEGLPVRGPRVLTWGNMDTGAPGLADPVPGATIIVNTIAEVNGYRIFASPWTPRFAGAYQLDLGPDASYEYWSKLLPPNADVDIVLTHGPPYGIADKTNGRHRGDVGLLRAVQALQKPPLLWVCGHIHEQYGIHRVPHARAPGGHILLVNSAVYYAKRPGHSRMAQPRAVRLPQAEVLPRSGNPQ